MKQLTIAIDGYSSCGKSTIAKSLAHKLNFVFVDSGAMYRAVTLYALRNDYIYGKNIDQKKIIASLPNIHLHFELNEHNKPELFLNDENVDKEIREMKVSNYVSPVATIPEVRYKLVNMQREMGKFGGVVMDGRDIGSVVFPDAELKFFLTAETSVRVERRRLELIANGQDVPYDIIERNLLDRDYRDSHREESPLIKVNDAIVVDNSNMTPKQQLDFILNIIHQKFNINF